MEGAAAQHRPDHRGDCLRFGEARRLNFRISAEPVGSVSEGKRSADGASITGTWAGTEPDFLGTQGRPLPLRLERHEADSVVPRVRNYTAGENYASDRLGDDVLAVIDALKLSRPVLAGHSLAGEELSSVGSRHPEKVAGLIYLEAAYHWAFYDQAHGDLIVDRNEVQRKLEQLQPGRQPQLPGALVSDLLEMLPALERDLRAEQEQLAGTPAATAQPKGRNADDWFCAADGDAKVHGNSLPDSRDLRESARSRDCRSGEDGRCRCERPGTDHSIRKGSALRAGGSSSAHKTLHLRVERSGFIASLN